MILNLIIKPRISAVDGGQYTDFYLTGLYFEVSFLDIPYI